MDCVLGGVLDCVLGGVLGGVLVCVLGCILNCVLNYYYRCIRLCIGLCVGLTECSVICFQIWTEHQLKVLSIQKLPQAALLNKICIEFLFTRYSVLY